MKSSLFYRFISNKTPFKIDSIPQSEITFKEASHTNYKLHKLKWSAIPKTFFITKKPLDQKANMAFIKISKWITSNIPDAVILSDFESTHSKKCTDKDVLEKNVDLIITLGGDGTILHVSSLFEKSVPPVISFSLGSLGFLLPFSIDKYETVLSRILECELLILYRMRIKASILKNKLIEMDEIGSNESQSIKTYQSQSIKTNEQSFIYNCMNEIILHRGLFPHLTNIRCSINDSFLTKAIGDGLILSTPTGSTAYSLSAGGPIVHPSLPCILMTPICPRSLSFRPIILPPNCRLSFETDSDISISQDGRDSGFLQGGSRLDVCQSEFPIPCVVDNSLWADDLNDILGWNKNFVNSALVR